MTGKLSCTINSLPDTGQRYRRYLVLAVLFLVSFKSYSFERYRTLCDTTFVSASLGYTKNITITVPREWQEDLDQRFPLIIIFDRQNQRSHQYILSAIDYLTSNEQMPSAVIVSVMSVQQYRFRETVHPQTDSSSLSEANEAFLFEELIPLMEKKYKAGKFRMLIGHSRYGYFATALLCKRSHELNAVIALSPFYRQKNVNLKDSLHQLQKEAAETIYYEYGMGNDYPEDYQQLTEVLNNPPVGNLHTKGYCFPEADHNVTPGLIIGPALYDVFEFWSSVQTSFLRNKQQEANSLSALTAKITEHYQASLNFSLGMLNGKGWDYYNDGLYEKAIAAWEMLLQSYPNFAEAYLYIADARKQSGKEFKDILKKFDSALKNSVMYSPEEKTDLNNERNALQN